MPTIVHIFNLTNLVGWVLLQGLPVFPTPATLCLPHLLPVVLILIIVVLMLIGTDVYCCYVTPYVDYLVLIATSGKFPIPWIIIGYVVLLLFVTTMPSLMPSLLPLMQFYLVR